MKVRYLVAAVTLLTASGLQAQTKAPIVEVTISDTSFLSDGKPIAVELIRPQEAAQGEAPARPAVLILHGSDGISYGRYPYVKIASALARAGYVAAIVRYFDRTDTTLANSWTERQNFSLWRRTISDAVGFVASQPGVDPKRVGLLGVSLGASLAMALASQDPRIGAVVEYFGELPEEYVTHMRRMPPTLILHGEDDRVVSVQAAYRLEALLKKKAVPCEIKTYPGQGHGFKGASDADALARAAAFFGKHL
jgi:carboxymethylenebutenolidase